MKVKQLTWAAGLLFVCTLAQAETKLQVALPQGRTAFQTNELIDFAVTRSDTAALPAEQLSLALAGDDGTKINFAFALPAVAVEGPDARRTEHVHLNGWLLRPGHYTLEIRVGPASLPAGTEAGATTAAAVSTPFDLYSHVRKSSYKLIDWGRANKAPDQLVLGEESIGFNLIYGGYMSDAEANFIRAGIDFMSCCTMGGAHQMDIRSECDWSDPYSLRGGTARVTRRSFVDRTRPNVWGVHFYDEPGLTWGKDPATGQMTAHMVPSQHRSFKSAFGEEPLKYSEVKADDPAHLDRWRNWARWKLGFMDAAWKDAQFGVSYVRPDYLSVNQSQYGFSAFTDGYYFNVVRCMPIVSGHGGYDDYGLACFNPSYFLEIARARDFTRPCWYLPTWYGNTPTERFRLEQYLSFMTNVQGMISPPDIDPYQPFTKVSAEGVVESNQLMSRLGTVFTTMPVTKPPVALLYSISNLIEEQARDTKKCYAHDTMHGRNLNITYLAGKLLQQQFLTVVDEDIVDGTLAANHKAVVLTSINYLDPRTLKALEAFAAKGGLVMLTSDCKVKVAGGVDIGNTPALPENDKINRLMDEKKYQEMQPLVTFPKYVQGAQVTAKAIKTQLDKAGIKPIFECDNPLITATRQAAGDIEYLFAVNMAFDPDGKYAGPNPTQKATSATVALVAQVSVPAGRDAGATIYDAVRGGPAAEFKDNKAALRFGPGELRVFARTAKPVGGVKVGTPVVQRDYVAAADPLKVDISACVVDNAGAVLSGSAPLEIRVTDPLGNVRYLLHRATRQGAFSTSLPLALNDPSGDWKVSVRELLAGTEGTATFKLEAVPQCAALAGKTWRAIFLPDDRNNVFRFFRVHQDVTIATGSGAYNTAAAERLAESLKPWDVRCKIVPAAEVGKRRELPEEAKTTWCGLEPGRCTDTLNAKYGPAQAGFAVQGPVVLLGTPEDNPIIKFAQDAKFLPYKPAKDAFPGRGQGYVAWQRGCVGVLQESIALIAYDAAGMSEAVGTVYELVAGMEPLTPLSQPETNAITAVSKATPVPECPIAWQALLPDRAVSVTAENDKVVVTTYDGSAHTFDTAGKSTSQDANVPTALPKLTPPKLPDALKGKLPATRVAKFIVDTGGPIAVGHWGGTLQVFDAGGVLKTQQFLGQDINGMVWAGGKLVVALADGRVVAVSVK